MHGAAAGRGASWRLLLRRVIILAAGVALLGCGRKTDVKPPEFAAPEALHSVGARNVGAGIRVSWERPRRCADGSPLRDLAAFRVERSIAGGPFETIAKLAVSDRDRFRQIRRFRYLDEAVATGERYRYRVFSYTVDGLISEVSNVVEVVRELAPGVAATPGEETR